MSILIFNIFIIIPAYVGSKYLRYWLDEHFSTDLFKIELLVMRGKHLVVKYFT